MILTEKQSWQLRVTAAVFFTIGFVSPFWSWNHEVNYFTGLIFYCYQGQCATVDGSGSASGKLIIIENLFIPSQAQYPELDHPSTHEHRKNALFYKNDCT